LEYLLRPPEQRRECVWVNDLFAVISAARTTASTEVLSKPRRLDHAIGSWQILGQMRYHRYVSQVLRLRSLTGSGFLGEDCRCVRVEQVITHIAELSDFVLAEEVGEAP
jgi:hypothetical protein